MSHASDGALAEAAIAGDRDAFAELYARHQQRAFQIAYGITGTLHDAADATHDAFVGVLARLPRLAGRDLDFGAYLRTSVRHASYRLIDKRASRAELVDALPEQDRTAVRKPEQEPDRNVLLAAQQEEIRIANSTLPERQREALALRELEGLSYDEIAAIMGMNRNSVAQLISRARIGLHNALRLTALQSIAPPTPDCERARSSIAMLQDGERSADDWISQHLTSCHACASAREAMAEAGASYRLWAPVAAGEYLRRDTIAEAGVRLGHEWGERSARRPAVRARLARALRTPSRRRGVLAAIAAALLLLLLRPAWIVDSVAQRLPSEPVITPLPAASGPRPTPPSAATVAAAAPKAPPRPSAMSPYALADGRTVDEDSGATPVPVLVNDVPAGGAEPSIASLVQPAHGTIALAADHRRVTYEPDHDYCNTPTGDIEPDAFAYRLDGGARAPVFVRVRCIDDPPAAADDRRTLRGIAGVLVIDVLANDDDVDGGAISIRSFTPARQGTVSRSRAADGAPGLRYEWLGSCYTGGEDTFTYTLNGGSSARVVVQVGC